MNCPNCKAPLDNKDYCLNCNMDINLFKRTQRMSKILFNKGLDKAQNRNLVSGIIDLKKSIYFDKNNIDARNLLGLIYFEIGQIANALAQWIVSSSLVEEDNIASEYLSIMHKNERLIDDMNDGVKSYNQALNYTKQGSVDMAIIQLKRVEDINPKLLEAYILLAFCYMTENNKKEALFYVEKALDIDNYNEKALQYYNKLSSARKNSIKTLKDENQENKVEVKRVSRFEDLSHKKTKSTFSVTFLISFLIGAILTAAAMHLLIFPSIVSNKDSKISELENKISKLVDGGDENELENLDTLEKTNKELQAKNKELQEYKDTVGNKLAYDELDNFYINAQYEEAVNTLSSVNESLLSEEEKERFNIIKEEATNKYITSKLSDGKNQYNWGNYIESRAAFEVVISLSEDESNIVDALYYLARICEQEDKINEAKKYYNQIINDYPDSFRVSDAEYRINQLN